MRFALFTLACFPLLVAAAPVPKAGPPRVLVVASNKGGNWDIYLVIPATGETKNLTDHKATDVEPAWSPDGQRIAFVSNRGGTPDIWTMATNGTDVEQVTKKQGACTYLRWSPNGKFIAFECPVKGRVQIHTVEVATGKVVQLTDTEIPGRQPAWSPDSKKISYTTTGGRWNGLAMDADGTNVEKVSGDLGAVDMNWSPDGKQITFTDVREVNGWRLFIMDADGKNAKLLNKNGNTYGNVYPRWSPDGKRISYGEMVNGVVQVGVINADGTGLKVITEKHRHLYTRWSPDGKSLSYVRFETNKPAVLVVSDPGGQNAKELLTHVAPIPAEWKPK